MRLSAGSSHKSHVLAVDFHFTCQRLVFQGFISLSRVLHRMLLFRECFLNGYSKLTLVIPIPMYRHIVRERKRKITLPRSCCFSEGRNDALACLLDISLIEAIKRQTLPSILSCGGGATVPRPDAVASEPFHNTVSFYGLLCAV